MLTNPQNPAPRSFHEWALDVFIVLFSAVIAAALGYMATN